MAKSKLSTSIIAGSLKGKEVLLPSKEVTRSSKAILKESLFNTLQFEIYDTVFVEVFAGSGSVGLEAISRGASRALFIEKDNDSFRVLRENTQKLAQESTRCYHGDSFELLPSLFQELPEDESTYFYFDPPFSIREGMDEIYDRVIATIEKIPILMIKMVIIEHMTQITFPDSVGDLAKIKEKKFGKSSLSYYISKQ